MRVLYACLVDRHDPALVALAALICCLGVGTAFVLGRDVLRTADRRARLAWAAAAVLALTCAIWATHFIAMLAFEPGLPARFGTERTVLSFLLPFGLVGLAAAVIVASPGIAGRIVGGAIAGLAISAMHYVGMSAFQVQGSLVWDNGMVAASVASGAALSALAAALPLRETRAARLAAPAAFVLAVVLAHFIGMASVTVVFDPAAPDPEGVVDSAFLVVLVANVSLTIVGLALAAAWFAEHVRRQSAAAEAQLRDLTEVSVHGLMIFAGDVVVRVNPSLERIMGCDAAEILGRSFSDILSGTMRVPTRRETEAFLHPLDGDAIPVRVMGKDATIQGQPHFVVAVRDQREALRDQAKMTRLAHHDALTGLANRVVFNETLARRLLLPEGDDERFAVLMLDLDRFKAVNDTFGHGMGDELLRAVAGRLRQAVREDDVVARLGGDEFAIVAGMADGVEGVRAVARRVIALLSEPFMIEGQRLEIGTSVGIALAPDDGDAPTDLSRNADLALYCAKEEGGSTHRFFEASMNEQIQQRRRLETDLRQALAKGEMEVHYQPLTDPRSGVFHGAEALVRWRHPERGMVPPSVFIPVAEELGLVGAIGDFVLRTACAEATRWPAPLSVAVNLSPLQFKDARLVESIRAALEDTGLPPSRLELEVTETALLQDEGSVLAALNALRALGVRLSMDDFGTGYSSLSYLRRFPFDKIKIDQSFIRQVPDDPDSIAIVQAITGLGAKLGMTITAEGVETTEQRRFIATEGCDQIQGYLISKPIPADEIREMFGVPVGEAVAA